MITFHAVCYAHHRRADGSYPVKIKVTFKRVHRHLPTNLTARAGDLTRTLHLKSPQLIAASNELIDRMRGAVSDLSFFDLEGRDCEWIVGYIRKKLTEENFSLNFYEWCEGRAINRARLTALRVWKAYAGTETDINDITAKMLDEFVDYVNTRPQVKKVNTAGVRYLEGLSAMFNEAKRKYNDEDAGVILIPRSPFQRVTRKASPAEGQRNIGRDTIQRMIAWKGGRLMQEAVDMFLISFALMGANLTDLRGFKERDGWWVYHRNKTAGRRADRALMKVRIPDCIRGRIGRVDFGRFSTDNVATHQMNIHLKKWAEANGVEPFTMYAARHSWASIARGIGVEKATVDECLAHIGDFKIADIYAERNWDAINEANSRVLALFEW